MSNFTLEDALPISERLINIRRTIHRNPELGFQEFKTSALIAETLSDLGIQVETGVGETGVIGYLGNGPPVIMLRADMEDLPIHEENQISYSSQVPGVMHACGHDAHVACLLGAAMLLHEVNLPGQVRFLFQPCEEGRGPDCLSGAQTLVEAGIMDNVDAVVGLHVFTDAPLGSIEVSAGPLMAAVDEFDLSIIGQSAHGADPYKGVDAIVITAQVLSAIQAIVSRRLPAMDAGVITVGTIHGGEGRNILAETVALEGTIRTFVPAVRDVILAELKRTCEIALSMGGKCELIITPHVPAVNNNPDLTLLIQHVGSDILGEKKVHRAHPEMGGEDFAFLIQNTPGVYFRLGVATPGEPLRRTHTSTFDLDERALPIGAAILAETSRRWLTNT